MFVLGNLEGVEIKVNKYNKNLFEKLAIIDEKNKELKRKSSKTILGEDNIKKSLAISNNLQSKTMDRSAYLPKSATMSQKNYG